VVNSGILPLGTNNTNTFTGGIDLNGSELQFAVTSILGSLNTQSASLDDGAITFKCSANIVNDTQAFSVSATGSSIKVDTPNKITWRIGGVVSGPGDWSKFGTGVLALDKKAPPARRATSPVHPRLAAPSTKTLW
jgi:hypothetical protein